MVMLTKKIIGPLRGFTMIKVPNDEQNNNKTTIKRRMYQMWLKTILCI